MHIIDEFECWLFDTKILSSEAKSAVSVRLNSLHEDLNDAGVDIYSSEAASYLISYIDMGGDFDAYKDKILAKIKTLAAA